jgi:catechol 2,3-dioxygenase-like lactoylglutathione lyase family enzyme
MHRGKLSGILIDCDEETMEAATRFWSQALGMPEISPRKQGSPYVNLQGRVDSVHVELQQIGSASRIHLDIESDDIEAEVQRLVGLGARKKEFIHAWWVMEDPAGMLFCVIPQVDEESLGDANVWDG